ncbi:MAG TPA: DUF5652 family protein [Candidatus Paceibacterota bacterium]|nr:DUF5652 family protein [Candidatus Paceibacterota bacterium]
MYTHHYGFDTGWFMNIPIWSVPFLGLAFLAAIWSLAWKGIALWHAGRNNDGWWFIAILLINSVGILEIVYLFFVLKLKFEEVFPFLRRGPHHPPHHHNHPHA